MSSPESNYRAWLEKAENDLLNIENNLAASRVPWDTVCFHAHQAAEKLIKAFLVYHGILPPRTHDLVALLSQCVSIEEGLAKLDEDCRKLSVFAVAARYPADLFAPREEDATQMIAAARRIRAAVLRLLPPAEPRRS